MKVKILDLIDFEKIDTLLEGFNQSTGFVTAILDLKGNVLSKSGWRQICTVFHRVHPDTANNCTISDTVLAGELQNGQKYHFYKCLNGMVDVAVPIVIKGEHIANLFSGQFFFEEPDISFFKKQAGKHGFDEEKYLKALSKVPVVSKEKVLTAMDFLLNLTQLISEMTFHKLEQTELNKTIKENEEKFKSVFESANVGKSITLPTGEINVNQAFCDMLGYSRDELYNKKWQDITPEAEIPVIQKILEPLLKGEKDTARFEKRYICKNGTLIWGDESVSICRNENDKPLYFITTITDITERKQSEKQLLESERKYRLLFESNPQPMWVYDTETLAFLAINDAAVLKYGYSKEEFLQMTIRDIRPPEDVSKLLNNVNSVISGFNEAGVWRHCKKDGSIIFVEITAYVIDYEGKKAELILASDITERIKTDEKLKASESLFRKIFEDGATGMVMAGHDFKFQKANRNFCQMTGYSEVELQQLSFSQITYPDDILKDIQNVKKMLSGETDVYRTEKRYLKKDGQLFWADLTVSPIFDPNGRFLYFVGIIIDITERRYAEEAKREIEKRLELVLEGSQLGYWDWNIQTGTVYRNEIWAEMLGYTLQEIEFNVKQWSDLQHPDDQPVAWKSISDHLEGRTAAHRVEYRMRTKDGQYKWILDQASIVERDGQGKPLRMSGTHTDITERKLAEKALHDAHDQLEKIVATTPGIVCSFRLRADGSMCFPYGGERIASHFGIRNAALDRDASPFLSMTLHEDLTGLAASINQSAKLMSPWSYEWRVTHPEKGILWVEGNSMPLREADGSTLWYGVTSDITKRKLAEINLAESEKRYRTLFENMNAGFVLFEVVQNEENKPVDLVIVAANKVFEKTTGLKLIDSIGMQLTKVLPGIENDAADWIGTYSKVALTGESVQFEDGSEQLGYYFSISAYKAGPGLCAVTYVDITKRRQFELDLKQSEEKFNKAFHNSPDAITITRASDGKLIDVNDSLLRISGYKRDEVVGNTSLLLNLWSNPADRSRYVLLLKEKGSVKNFESKFITSSGEVRDFLVSGEMFVLNNETCILGILRDITEIKLAEKKLLESEEKYRSIYENSSVAILLSSPDGRVLSANDFACRIFGRTEREICEAARKGLVDLEDPRLTELLRKRSKYGRATGELNFLKKDGSKFPGEVSSVIFTDKNGNKLSSMIIRDMTEQKEAEAEILNLNRTLEQRIAERTAQLEETNRELEAFSYSVSHDLRAPLRHINGYVDLLNARYSDNLPDKAKHYLSVVTDASKQMGTLIDDLLQFSKTGRQDVRKTDVDMNLLIKEVVGKIKPEVKSRRVTWNIQDLPEVYCDYSLLKQVWYNLLDNAVKYTRNETSPEIAVGYKEEADSFVFFVTDNGVGFDMRYAHKLFGVFQRLHSHAEFEGTGIGLANVQRIVHKHNGKVWAEAELGRGAKFFFTLPKNQEEK